MGYEEEVHTLLKSRRGEFLRFSQIKASLGLRDVQLSKALRRLEDDGLVVRHSVEYDRKPVNTYLGDSEDLGFKVTVYVDGNWMFCWFEWKYEDGSSKATSMNQAYLPLCLFIIACAQLGPASRHSDHDTTALKKLSCPHGDMNPKKKKWWKRVNQATRFWTASFGLFVLAVPIWIFNKLMDVLPLNGQAPPLSWWYYVVSYVSLWAVFFYIISKFNPVLWKSMRRFLLWMEEKKEDSYYP